MNLIDDTKKHFAESFADAAKFSDQCDSKAKARGKAIFVIWALYLLLFLVPDSAR